MKKQSKQHTINTRIVKNWNLKYPIGTEVVYQRVKGEDFRSSKTRSEAYISSDGEPVIYLEHVSGYYSLLHVQPQEAQA